MENHDGQHGQLESELQRILEAAGEGPFIDLLSKCDLVSIVNWTMILMTSIFRDC